MERLKTEALSAQLFEIGAIKFGAFRLKLHDTHPEAPLSPIYIDLRMLRRFPQAKLAAVNVYCELIAPLKFDLLADIPTAATPLVASLSDRLKIGMITPRTDAKAHGTGAKIDGFFNSDKGKVVLLIDDLVTKADSKLEAAKILIQNGLIVGDVVVLIDREQGGKSQLEEAGLKLHSALTMQQMLDYYLETGTINDLQYEDTMEKLKWLNNV
ncbi:MAG: hypothetical protein Q8P91_01970 [bacterium]|nr:hypothetical protein [bacterium]